MAKTANKRAVLLASLTLVFFYAGCVQQGQNNPGATTVPAGPNTVTIKDFAFNPPQLTIKKGDAVTWTNQDSVPHQIVADSGEFKSEILSPGQSFSRVFSSAGAIPYHCGIHPSMKGTVTAE